MGQGIWLCGFKFQFFPEYSPHGMTHYYVNLYTPSDHTPGILHNRPPQFLCVMTKDRKIKKNAKLTVDNPGGGCYHSIVDRATAQHIVL